MNGNRLIIAGAIILTALAVFAIEFARRRRPRRCPTCGGDYIHEWNGELVCGVCHNRWRDDE